jgi:hypothetical protein
VVVVHLRRKRRPFLFEVGNELAKGRRIENRSGEHVRSGLARFLEDGNRQRLARVLFLQLRQPQRGRHAGRSPTDNQDVNFEGFAFQNSILAAIYSIPR